MTNQALTFAPRGADICVYCLCEFLIMLDHPVSGGQHLCSSGKRKTNSLKLQKSARRIRFRKDFKSFGLGQWKIRNDFPCKRGNGGESADKCGRDALEDKWRQLGDEKLTQKQQGRDEANAAAGGKIGVAGQRKSASSGSNLEDRECV